MDVAIDAIEAVMHAAGNGDAEAPVRTMQSVMRPGKEDFVFVVMPSVWRGRQAAAAKIVSNVPDNPLENRATVQGVAVMFDVETGSPSLIVDAATLTTIRTGAVVGLATRFLARSSCNVLGIIGTGGIAADLVKGVAAVRGIDRVLVNDIRPIVAATFAEQIPFDAQVVNDNDELASRSDILITATSATDPAISAGTVQPGTHINAVGNFSPTGREIPGAVVAASTRYVDDINNAMEEAGEFILAASEGLIPPGAGGITGDLQGLVLGKAAPRTNEEEITLFKTVGTALSDVAGLSAAAVAAEAEDLGVVLT
jgi:ornithine cyclodeaminase